MLRGEVCGLEWKHVNFEEQTISIEQSATHLKGQYITKAPKTDESIREIPVGKKLIDILKKCKEWYDSEKARLAGYWQDSDRILVRHDGQPINPSTISGWLKEMIKKTICLMHIVVCFNMQTFHLQVNTAGLSVREVADYAGHTCPNVTLSVYSHSFNNSKSKVAQFFDNFIEENNSEMISALKKV